LMTDGWMNIMIRFCCLIENQLTQKRSQPYWKRIRVDLCSQEVQSRLLTWF
jgi:hypothetical protein